MCDKHCINHDLLLTGPWGKILDSIEVPATFHMFREKWKNVFISEKAQYDVSKMAYINSGIKTNMVLKLMNVKHDWMITQKMGFVFFTISGVQNFRFFKIWIWLDL